MQRKVVFDAVFKKSNAVQVAAATRFSPFLSLYYIRNGGGSKSVSKNLDSPAFNSRVGAL